MFSVKINQKLSTTQSSNFTLWLMKFKLCLHLFSVVLLTQTLCVTYGQRKLFHHDFSYSDLRFLSIHVTARYDMNGTDESDCHL